MDIYQKIMVTIMLVLMGVSYITALIKYMRNKRKQKQKDLSNEEKLKLLEEEKNILENNNQLFGLIPNLIKQAEVIFPSIAKTGASKLMYVLYELQQYAFKNNMEFDESIAKEYIETILETPQKKMLTVEDVCDTNDVDQNQIKGEEENAED